MDESQVGWNAAEPTLPYSALSTVPVHILAHALILRGLPGMSKKQCCSEICKGPMQDIAIEL